MKIIYFGDIVGRPGREGLELVLPGLKKEFEPDFIFANAENVSHGKGVTVETYQKVINSGVDGLTSGNHVFAKKDVFAILEDKSALLLRPANYPEGTPGRGWQIFKSGTKKVLVINLIGRVFMRENFDDPFLTVEKILEDYCLSSQDKSGKEVVDAILVDWHTEATSEKKALAYYLDGRVSAVLGTHTHVQTADNQILPKGTAYISDLGMVGPHYSVLGRSVDDVLKLFLTQRSSGLEMSDDNEAEIGAVNIEVDSKTGLAKNIERINKIVKL